MLQMILEYAVVFLFVLDTNTVYSVSYSIDFHIPEATVIMLLIYLSTIGSIRKTTLKRYGQFLLIYEVLIIFIGVMIVSEERVLGYIARFILGLPMIILFFVKHIEDGSPYAPMYKYVNIMTWISIISLFFWIFGTQLHLVMPTGVVQGLWGNQGKAYAYPSYFWLYFERQGSVLFGTNILRNQGIFTEGPMFSLCLVLAIAIEFFLPHEYSSQKSRRTAKCKLMFLVTALITTITTTGQILLIFMIMLRYLLNKPRSSFNVIVKWIFFGVILILGSYTIMNIYLAKSTSNSWINRLDDFLAGFKSWLSSPIWGLRSYSDLSTIYSFRSSFRQIGASVGFSNSITNVLSQGGIMFTLVYLVPLYTSAKKFHKRELLNFSMFLSVLVLEFIFTSCAYKFITLFFFAFLYGLGFFASNAIFYSGNVSRT